MLGEHYAYTLFTPHVLLWIALVIVFFLRFCYKFKRTQYVRWTRSCNVRPFIFYLGRHCLLFLRFVINLRGKNIKLGWIYGLSSPRKFWCGQHCSLFLFKEKIFFLYFVKLILILFLFIFRLIYLLSFMLFRNPIWNENYFSIMHLIF